MIHEAATLTNLTINSISGTKKDKTATEVTQSTFQAGKKSGRYVKQIFPKDSLDPITKAAANARALHYKYTLPWSDRAERLLPNAASMDYTEAMNNARTLYEREVNTFLSNYQHNVWRARQTLGAMFCADDYPSVDALRQKFSFDVNITPVPSGRDFRVDLPKATLDKLKEELDASVASTTEKAINDLRNRIENVVYRMVDRLSQPQAVFHDTLVENARELCQLIPALNVTNDATITDLHKAIQEHLTIHNAEDLRKDQTLRNQTANAANDILNRMKLFQEAA